MKEYYILLFKEQGKKEYKELYTRPTKEELIKKVEIQIEDDIKDGLEYEYRIEYRREEGSYSTSRKKKSDMFVSMNEGKFIS